MKKPEATFKMKYFTRILKTTDPLATALISTTWRAGHIQCYFFRATRKLKNIMCWKKATVTTRKSAQNKSVLGGAALKELLTKLQRHQARLQEANLNKTFQESH